MSRHSTLADDVIRKSWKLISSQSERQLGAYIFVFAATFRDVAPTLSNQMTELRNNVIHKGILPEKHEAVEFG
jgi:hypothetical protein